MRVRVSVTSRKHTRQCRTISHDSRLVPHVRASLSLRGSGVRVRTMVVPIDRMQRDAHPVHAHPSRRLSKHVHGDTPPEEAATAHVACELHAQWHRHEGHTSRTVDASVELQVRFEVSFYVRQTTVVRISERTVRKRFDAFKTTKTLNP